MAEFGIPDEPGFRGAPVLGPLASSVAGFTQGLERGLESRARKKAVFAKQQADEKAANIKAGRAAASQIRTDFGDLNKTTTDRIRELDRQRAVLIKRRDDPLVNLDEDQKSLVQSEISVIDAERGGLLESSDALSRAEIAAKVLPPHQQRAVSFAMLDATRPRDFKNFAAFEKFKKDFTANFGPAAGKTLGEVLEGERAKGTIRIIADILGPPEKDLTPDDESFLQGAFGEPDEGSK